MVLLAIRLIGGVAKAIRRRPTKSSGGDISGAGPAPEPKRDLKDLSPYEIEDADYEDLPKREE